MAEATLGVPARAALLALMATGREVANADLRPWLGRGGITKPVRDLLIRERLIVSRREGRTHHHQLTTIGWQWCLDELRADRPPRSGSMGGAMYAVLRGLSGYLERSGNSLPDVFGPAGAGDADATRSLVQDEVQDAIRQQYQKLAAFPNEWVRLADVRAALSAFERGAVDRALLQMNRLPDVNLAPEPIQSLLTELDLQAAVDVGGKANHLLAIDSDA